MKLSLVILGVAFLALIYLYFQKPKPVDFNENPLLVKLDSINEIIKSKDSSIAYLNTQYLQLESQKEKIRVIYKDRLVFIDKADINQLDSLIRASIK